MSVGLNCSIPADPDISGIGVRIAIYAQNLLSFIPVIGVLRDRQVTLSELESTRTIGLSAFHANIVLSLSWMNNTNTFVYFLLYVQHRTQEGPARIKLDWASWMGYLAQELSVRLSLRKPSHWQPDSTRFFW
ncbi:hypothetical protein C8R47DRAFT_1180040 [Mycena vitilis]|nr:hypothetical protein C8R47DRAFT_1180040 [Mycena vitilis]